MDNELQDRCDIAWMRVASAMATSRAQRWRISDLIYALVNRYAGRNIVYPSSVTLRMTVRKPVDGMDERYGVPMDTMRNCNLI